MLSNAIYLKEERKKEERKGGQKEGRKEKKARRVTNLL